MSAQNYKAWMRDKQQVMNNFKVVGQKQTPSWVCRKTCRIYYPVHYEEKNLADVGDVHKTLGIVCIEVDGAYAVLSVNAMIEFSPSETNVVEMDGEQYYEMVFDAGSVVIEDMNVVQKDTLSYFIYDIFISKGRIPWYLSYLDMCRLFDTALEYAGARVGDRPEVIQLMVSIIARSKKDRNIYYREIINKEGKNSGDLVFIPIKSVEYGATNTISKLGGSHFQTGVVSALVHPSTGPVEHIESLLRY